MLLNARHDTIHVFTCNTYFQTFAKDAGGLFLFFWRHDPIMQQSSYTAISSKEISDLK